MRRVIDILRPALQNWGQIGSDIAAPSSQLTQPFFLVAPETTSQEVALTITRLARLPREVIVVIQTSGSATGMPKLVGLSAENLLTGALATLLRLARCDESRFQIPHTFAQARQALPETARGTWVTGLPVHHIAGLQLLTRAILADTEPITCDFSSGFQAAELAATLKQHHGDGPLYTSLVPTQLHAIVADPPDGNGPVGDPLSSPVGQPNLAQQIASSVTAILVGGAALPTSIATKAHHLALPIVSTYGMSETGGGCVYDGHPLAGVSARILHPDAAGIGRIQLAGPMVVDGYLTDDAPHNRPTSTGYSTLTADLGSLTDGRLTVLGRTDDVIVTGGAKVAPLAVEALLDAAGFPGVIVGVPHPVWGQIVVFVAAGTAVASLTQLRAALANRPAEFSPRAAVTLPDLPLRGPGKIDRRRLAQQAAQALASGVGEARDRIPAATASQH